MAFLEDYALKDIIKISCSNFAGKHIATIRQIKSGNLNNAKETIWATGMNEAKLAAFNGTESATFTAQSGLISDGGFILNGAGVKVTTNGTGYLYEEVITLANAATCTLKHDAQGTVGAEIGYIYACDANGNIDPNKTYEQDTAASATEFTYAAATRTITLPTSVFQIGDHVLVKYKPKFTSLKEIYRDAGATAFNGQTYIFVLAKKICDDTIHLGQLYFPNSHFEGNYDLAFGDTAAVQDFTIEALQGCDGTGKFWHFYIADEDEIVDTDLDDLD